MSFKTCRARKSLYYAFLPLISNISASPIIVTTSRNDLISVTPTPVSVTPSFVSNVYENTHTSTIGANGYATSVPIVGGSECWFCPSARTSDIAEETWTESLSLNNSKNVDGTSGAWALLGINSPGIYQPSAASGFSTNIPIITVLYSGDPIYSPSQTLDQSTTNSKRQEVRVKYKYEDTDRFKLLARSIKSKEPDIQQNAGYAIKLRKNGKWLPIPLKYRLLAGFVHYKVGSLEADVDCDGNVIKAVRTIIRDWDVSVWELALEEDKNTIYASYATLTKATLAPNSKYLKRTKVTYLGRIEIDATEDFITGQAEAIAEEMNDKGGYYYLLNNCRDFVSYLWREIKYREKRSLADTELESNACDASS